jgi:hypothetical protein
VKIKKSRRGEAKSCIAPLPGSFVTKGRVIRVAPPLFVCAFLYLLSLHLLPSALRARLESLSRKCGLWPNHTEHPATSRPIHRAYVDGFFTDKTDVTNAQFAAFVKATGYITIAEKTPTAEEFPGAPPENLYAGGIVFSPPNHPVKTTCAGLPAVTSRMPIINPVSLNLLRRMRNCCSVPSINSFISTVMLWSRNSCFSLVYRISAAFGSQPVMSSRLSCPTIFT